MISRELEAEILRLYHAEHWRIGTLAHQAQESSNERSDPSHDPEPAKPDDNSGSGSDGGSDPVA